MAGDPHPKKLKQPGPLTRHPRLRHSHPLRPPSRCPPWVTYRLDPTWPREAKRSELCGGKTSPSNAAPSGSLPLQAAATSMATAAGASSLRGGRDGAGCLRQEDKASWHTSPAALAQSGLEPGGPAAAASRAHWREESRAHWRCGSPGPCGSRAGGLARAQALPHLFAARRATARAARGPRHHRPASFSGVGDPGDPPPSSHAADPTGRPRPQSSGCGREGRLGRLR